MDAAHFFLRKHSEESGRAWKFPALDDALTGTDAYFDQLSELAQFYFSLPNATVWSSGVELPLFQDYYFPEITAFKFFIHSRIKDRAISSNGQERFSIIRAKEDTVFVSKLNALLEMYNRVKSVEFWNPTVLDTTLSQIKY